MFFMVSAEAKHFKSSFASVLQVEKVAVFFPCALVYLHIHN